MFHGLSAMISGQDLYFQEWSETFLTDETVYMQLYIFLCAGFLVGLIFTLRALWCLNPSWCNKVALITSHWVSVFPRKTGSINCKWKWIREGKSARRRSFIPPKWSLVYGSVKRTGEDRKKWSLVLAMAFRLLVMVILGSVNFSEHNNLKMAKDQVF